MFEKNSTFFIMKKVVPLVIKVAPFAFLINIIMGILHGSMWGVITIVPVSYTHLTLPTT